ncbi:uncharacterized protein LOC131008412 [Salvia miltiorrhiza]|uniref:uncharacterized protein LOC131008412 n=1 Tax=Salvia miltiorrhiza TaxID=226208 RepID=UPI0025AC8AB7|nr:uncharacterized protein LOC131008412 [Salvia miltiorrhiza]
MGSLVCKKEIEKVEQGASAVVLRRRLFRREDEGEALCSLLTKAPPPLQPCSPRRRPIPASTSGHRLYVCKRRTAVRPSSANRLGLYLPPSRPFASTCRWRVYLLRLPPSRPFASTCRWRVYLLRLPKSCSAALLSTPNFLNVVNEGDTLLDVCCGSEELTSALEAFAGGHNDPISVAFGGLKVHGDREIDKEISFKGPIQPDASQCGFYVMKFMKEIVGRYELNAYTSLSSMFKNVKTYTGAEIDDIREEWATFVIKHVFD